MDVWDAANLNISQQTGTSNPLRNNDFPIYPARNNITRFSRIREFLAKPLKSSNRLINIMDIMRCCLARACIAQLFLHWGRPNPKIALRPTANDAIEWPCWSPVQWR